jgi:uncharacterized membrane protein (UPF0127 family)
MRYSVPCLLVALVFWLHGCSAEKTATLDDLTSRTVTLPGGQRIRAEVEANSVDMARGMMFRDSLAPDRGMLFVHERPGQYAYWMYQVKIPLDIIWMDDDHRIVELSAETPPCKTRASECPSYGGHATSRYVLELAGGMAKKYGLNTGDRIEF